MPDLSFRVAGLPPKKDGANSMWRKRSEVQRVLDLRRAARDEVGEGWTPLNEPFHLELVVHVGSENSRAVGDLDNMVTGVLDALQKAHPRTPVEDEPVWQRPEAEGVRPREFAVIEDDVHAVRISAEKRMGTEEVGYSLRIVTVER